MQLTSRQKGEAGEYATAAELAVRGWMVEMARRGATSIDLFAHIPSGARTCGVQIKTRASGDFQFSPTCWSSPSPQPTSGSSS